MCVFRIKNTHSHSHSERYEFRREEYSELPGPDPRRNVDHPDLGYIAVADRNWPGGEDGKCRERFFVVEVYREGMGLGH